VVEATYLSTNTNYHHTFILISELCESNCNTTGYGGISFNPTPDNYNQIQQFTAESTQLATFYDIDEDGRLDILIQRTNP